MRLVTDQADYSELDEDEKDRFVVWIERQKRKEFADAILRTRPGFDGDVFNGEVTESDIPHGERRAKNHKDIGDQITNLRWGADLERCDQNDDSEYPANVGEAGAAKYAAHGCTRINVTHIPDFRTVLLGRIDLNRGRELPGFMNFGVFRSEMAKFLQCWKLPMISFGADVSDAFTRTAAHLLEKQVDRHGHAPFLLQGLLDVLESHMKDANSEAEKRLGNLLEQETRHPMTQNHYFWDTIHGIRDERMMERLNGLGPDEFGKVDKEVVAKMLKSDLGVLSNESQEVTEMLDVMKAYWTVAMKRFVVEAAMIVTDVYTGKECAENMTKKLTSSLVLGMDDEEVQALFQETPSVVSKRRGLMEKQRRLKDAERRVNSGIRAMGNQ